MGIHNLKCVFSYAKYYFVSTLPAEGGDLKRVHLFKYRGTKIHYFLSYLKCILVYIRSVFPGD